MGRTALVSPMLSPLAVIAVPLEGSPRHASPGRACQRGFATSVHGHRAGSLWAEGGLTVYLTTVILAVGHRHLQAGLHSRLGVAWAHAGTVLGSVTGRPRECSPQAPVEARVGPGGEGYLYFSFLLRKNRKFMKCCKNKEKEKHPDLYPESPLAN